MITNPTKRVSRQTTKCIIQQSPFVNFARLGHVKEKLSRKIIHNEPICRTQRKGKETRAST
ncbi:hypothetical protein PISMIDRAFT_688611 [Pisolithus microcarpus 441]|uniref:Uncharacterized protein n=1 Tax=Pisolithus microcarpus 441 TaxID=765257 RepID=A0A0C9YIE3_9AGAM|nr:hypothetical protein PISMIDRAFT_688611 [Pisolithus microcarpus 441]